MFNTVPLSIVSLVIVPIYLILYCIYTVKSSSGTITRIILLLPLILLNFISFILNALNAREITKQKEQTQKTINMLNNIQNKTDDDIQQFITSRQLFYDLKEKANKFTGLCVGNMILGIMVPCIVFVVITIGKDDDTKKIDPKGATGPQGNIGQTGATN
jgi:hypothetical protein